MNFDNPYTSNPGLPASDADQPLSHEQRKEERESMNLQGLCELSDPPRMFPCVLVDLSGSGAQLRFQTTAQIPPMFKVHVEALNVYLECRTVWRTETHIGVEQSTRSAGYE